MTKERELKEAVREGRDRVSVFLIFPCFSTSALYFSRRLLDLLFFEKKFSRLHLI